jgi:2-keto-4-pentenoate hydratase/2-oxohepta-3-ene-1,7-dioic acid hydratase in catechol pathway
MHLTRADHSLAVIDDRGHATPIRHIIGIGRNYAEHAKEQGAAVPDRPMLFTKNLATLCMSGDDILVPKCCQDRAQVDFEGELGVITAHHPARDVSLADAMNHVLAYCVANDVSARWWQKEGAGGQFYRGKSFDTFCPISTPVAAASIADPQGLSIVTKVNGHTMQDGTTRDMIFSVAALIHEISKGHTLLPGTLILTGTPSGVGMARNPQVWLKDGDVVDVTIPHVGTLTNRVRCA